MPDFKLIPVIDLKGGAVVHAREGRRPDYKPVQSRLCDTPDPFAVVTAFARLFPFDVLYVADLDAIEGEGDHLPQLRELRRMFPAIELWVDSGLSDIADLGRWCAEGIGRVVLGSESIADPAFVATARRRCGALEPILSLDFSGDRFRGPSDLLEHPQEFWPRRVLAMNVRRVGSGKGPDLELLLALAKGKPGGCEVYAAGGVRSSGDLLALRSAGAAGALIATALHDASLGSEDLEPFMRGAARAENGKSAP